MKTQPSRAGGRSRLLPAALALLAALPLAGQESTWTLGGKALHRSLGAYSESGGGLSYGSATGLELELRARGEAARLEASVELSALRGDSASAALAASAGGLDPGLLVIAVGGTEAPAEAALAARLRTLVLKLELGPASLSAGRQIVNYGRGAYWSPVDLFADIDYSGVSLARRGTELLRLRLPLGALSGLDLVAAPRSEPAEGRYAARLSAYLLGIDGGLLGAWEGRADAGRLLLGADFKTDLLAGIYGEALYSYEPESGESAARAAAGLDFSLGELILAAEYYYNGGGPGADPLFPSAHYLYAAAAYPLSDFLALSLSAALDLAEGPARASLSLALDAAQGSTILGFFSASRGSFPAGGESLALAGGLSLDFKF